MLPADQLAVSHKEHLNHRVLPGLGQSHDVLIFPVHVGHLLPLGAGLHAADQIPITGSFLKLQLLCGLFHLLLEHVDDRPVISVQEIQRPLHVFLIFFLGNLTGADALALLHMIVQAGPRLPESLRKVLTAGPQMKNFLDQFDRILYRSGAGVGAEIAALVLPQGAGKENSGIGLPSVTLM